MSFWEQKPPKPSVWQQAYEAAEDQITDLRAEIRRLTDIIVELKREGFSPGLKPDVIAAQDDLPDAVMTAINARAAPHSNGYRDLVRGAREALAPDGSNSEDVAGLILRGAESEEE